MHKHFKVVFKQRDLALRSSFASFHHLFTVVLIDTGFLSEHFLSGDVQTHLSKFLSMT